MSLFLQVLPLAIGAAVSPTVLTVAVLVLSSKRRPLARTVAFLLGCWAVLLAIGVPGVFLFTNVEVHTSVGGPTFWIDLSAGVLLIALGVRRLLHKPTPHEKQGRKAGRMADAGLPDYVVLGLALMITNFTSLILYLPILKQIARSGAPPPERLAVLMAVQVIVLLVVLIPLSIRIAVPGPSARILGSLNDFTTKHSRAIMTGVLFLFGAYLVAKALLEVR